MPYRLSLTTLVFTIAWIIGASAGNIIHATHLATTYPLIGRLIGGGIVLFFVCLFPPKKSSFAYILPAIFICALALLNHI